MAGALFGNASTRSQSKNLVEFRAGKMTMKGKMVHPDKRKGLVYVYQSEDSLMHFCWKDRTKGTVEDDLIIFPDDVDFKHVAQCKTGRVYLLKFKSSSRKFFFWMQEPKTDKDEEYCKKVNENLNNPPTPGSSRGGSGGGLGGIPPEIASGLADQDLQSLLGNMNQQQLMQLLGGMGMGGGGGLGGLSALMGAGAGGSARPASSTTESNPPSRVQSSPGPRASTETPASTTPRPATTATAPTTGGSSSTTAGSSSSGTGSAAGSGAIQLSDLQNILSGMGGVAGAGKDPVDLAAAVTPEAMIPILANKEIQEKLAPHLPQGKSLPSSEEELRNTVKQPQFQQAMSSFSAALASGQLGPLMSQFGLGEDVVNAATQGDVEAFAKAMQAAQDKKKEGGEEKMDE